jgi:hypothetical protein
MSAPTRLGEMPAGVLCAAKGRGAMVCLVDTTLPLAAGNAEWEAIRPRIQTSTGRYWVVQIRDAHHDTTGGEHSWVAPQAVRGKGFGTYTAAVAAFATANTADTGERSPNDIRIIGGTLRGNQIERPDRPPRPIPER